MAGGARPGGPDLEDFEIVGAGEAPAPTRISAFEIELSGDEFESRLVATNDPVTIDAPEGALFAPNTTYTLTDDLGDTAALYVPAAAETDVEGVQIPAGLLAITGVVGPSPQGNRLTLLRASDLGVVVANEAPPRGALALDVANPVRGAATVRFATGAPASVSLVLLDARGRRVATLTAGDTDGAPATRTLDASGLAAGTYVLRLDAAGSTATRTLTVVR